MKKFKLIPIEEYETYMKSKKSTEESNNQRNINTTEKETQTEGTQFENISNSHSKYNQKNNTPPSPSPPPPPPSPTPPPPPGVPALIFNPKTKPIDKKDNVSTQWLKYWRKSVK